jgi:hypothetical protein
MAGFRYFPLAITFRGKRFLSHGTIIFTEL